MTQKELLVVVKWCMHAYGMRLIHQKEEI